MRSSINSSSWNVITRNKLWRNLICSHIFCVQQNFFQCSYSMIKKMLVLALNMNTNIEHLLLPMMVYQQHLIHQVILTSIILHSKTPHIVTVLWLDSDDVVTILSSTRNLVEGYKTVYLCHLDSYTVTVCTRYLVSFHEVTVSCLLGT